ncbi:hypothetical protein HAX54_003158, partial [Datura stramonium]|nr:hypothetical protein [Datura stramonium]
MLLTWIFPLFFGVPFLVTGKALKDSKKYEIIFQVKDEKITFKARKNHLLPIDVGNIFVVGMVDDENCKVGHKSKESSKKKKAK